MARVKRGPHRKEKRKRVLKLAKGYYGKKKNAYRIAKQAVDRALQFAYRDRRQKKREFRKLWIVRINAASRQNGLSYNRLIAGLRRAGVDLNRKILADVAVHDAEGFAAIVELAKEGLEMEPVPRPKVEVKPTPKVKAKPKPKPEPKKEAKPAAPKKAKEKPAEKAEKKPAAKKAAPKKAEKKAAAPKAEAAGPTKAELEKMTVADLKKLADKRGISEGDIEGSGASGNVVKADWVRVLAG